MASCKNLNNTQQMCQITFEWTGGCKMTCWQLDTYIWHLLRNNSIGKQMGNLIGYICPEMKQMCNFEISQTPTQWNSKCSKLFNLKTDGGTTNKKVHNQMAEAIGLSSIVLDKTESEKEQKRTLPSAHKAWLLRTRTHGGVCSSEPMWCLGAPSILKNATLAEDYVWRPLCLIMHDIMLKICTVCKKEVSCICCMYKIFVCTKCYVQKNICVYKKIFYLIF